MTVPIANEIKALLSPAMPDAWNYAINAALDVIESPRHPSDFCDVVRNGDSWICRFHHRYWDDRGICPGLRPR